MANSTDPYRRIGANSWQELLDQVNDVLQNPEPGCTALDPIEPPDPMHRWAKSDIREVHDKLNEIPTDCFTFQPIPDLWKVSIIEDIEGQLDNAWCDCTDEVCCYQCPNANDTGQTIFLGTETVGPDDCTECSGTSADIINCSNIRSGAYTTAVINFRDGIEDWAEGLRKECCAQNELDDLNDDLERLNDQLADLQQAKTNCITSCGSDANCITNCNSFYDPLITDKQQEITDKQQEITDKEAELATYTAQKNSGIAQWSGQCAAMNAAVDSMVYCDHTAARDLLDGLSYPIPPTRLECPERGATDNGEAGPNPCPCLDDFFTVCQTRYVLQRRVYETQSSSCNGTPLSLFDSGFDPVGSGDFDVDGTPCHTSDSRSVGCTYFHLLYYCSSNCCCCISPCGACCGHPNNDFNYDWQVFIRFPREVDPTDQEFGPCFDGVIGAEGPIA